MSRKFMTLWVIKFTIFFSSSKHTRKWKPELLFLLNFVSTFVCSNNVYVFSESTLFSLLTHCFCLVVSIHQNLLSSIFQDKTKNSNAANTFLKFYFHITLQYAFVCFKINTSFSFHADRESILLFKIPFFFVFIGKVVVAACDTWWMVKSGRNLLTHHNAGGSSVSYWKIIWVSQVTRVKYECKKATTKICIHNISRIQAVCLVIQYITYIVSISMLI